MRFLWSLGLICLCAVPLAAQRCYAFVELANGRVIVAPIQRIEDDSLSVVLADGVLTIAMADVQSLRSIDEKAFRAEVGAVDHGVIREPESEAPDPTPAEPDGAAQGVPIVPLPAPTATTRPGAIGAQLSPATRTASAMPVARGPVDAADGEEERGPDPHVSRLLDRYLWFIPQTPGHKTSLGAALLILLSVVVQLSARMANLDNGTFGLSTAFSVIVLLVLGLEATFLPLYAAVVAFAAAFNVLLWFYSIRILFRTGAFRAFVMMVSLFLACLVGVLVLQVVGFLLSSGGPL